MFVVFDDIAKCATLALRLWELGWSKAKNASDQYTEFGQDVHRLHENLIQLEGVFENVRHSTRGTIPTDSQFFNTSSLNPILDGPFETIKECEKLLRRKQNFAVNSNAVSNIIWNTTIAADVTVLHNRIKFHNLKIVALLAPLQIKLLLDIRSLVIENGQNILAKLADIEAKLSGNAPPSTTIKAVQCKQIQIPNFLWNRFEESSKARMPELQSGNIFPLNSGINAFLTHYQDPPVDVFSGYILLQPSQTPEQYLRLMKSIWIMQSIQDLPEYIDACNSGNRLFKLFVEGLADKCLAQFNRFAESPPGNPFQIRNQPTEATLLPLGEEAFAIWPKAVRELDDFDKASEDPLQKNILRAQLHPRNSSSSKEFILVRHDTLLLELVTKETSATDRFTNSQTKMIDLKKVSLTPLYADPDKTTTDIDLNLHPFGYRGPQDLLNFRTYKELYLFQEAITGYLAALDLLDVKVDIREDKAPTATKWRARLQLWNSRDDIRPEPQSPGEISRRDSRQVSDRSSSNPSHPSSKMTLQSKVTQLSYVTSHAGTEADAGIDAKILELPKQPYLVLFLRKYRARSRLPENQHMCLMRIPMHEGAVYLDKSNCRCRSNQKHLCLHTDLTGTKKMFGTNPLLVQRYTRPEMLNLALLGAHHEFSGNQTPAPEKLGFISFEFKTTGDCGKFDGWFRELQYLHKVNLDGYERSKRMIRKLDDNW